MQARFHNQRKISALRGKTINKIEGFYSGSEEIIFYCSDGTVYKMYHQCDSNEEVSVREIIGHSPKQVRFKTENEIAQVLLHVCVEHTNMQFYSATSSVDNPLGENDSIDVAASTTLFTIETENGIVTIVWGGIAYDLETSTEVDFVQVGGEGVWFDD